MVEAQACGTPVISFGRGGALDIIVAAPAARATGVLFDQQSPAAIVEAVDRFEALSPPISAVACRANALRFGASTFRAKFTALVTAARDGPPAMLPGAAEPDAAAALQAAD